MSLADGTAWENENKIPGPILTEAKMKPLDFSNTRGHAMAFFTSPLASVRDYDPTDDGPEVGTITRILASHKLYTPGKEGEMLRFQHFVDDAARAIFGDRYGRLGKKRQATVRKFVVMLHLEGKGPGTVELS